MANVTVNTAFHYSTSHDPKAKLESSETYKLTLDLDKKFISAIQPHIPSYVKRIEGVKICQAYGYDLSKGRGIGHDVNLYYGAISSLSVEIVLRRAGLLKVIKLGAEDITIDKRFLLGVSFVFPYLFPPY